MWPRHWLAACGGGLCGGCLRDGHRGSRGELGSGGAWDDSRLTKAEIAADPEAAALATYFRQTTSEQLGVTAADVTVVSIDTTGKRQAGENGETQEVQSNYLLSENARSRSA